MAFRVTRNPNPVSPQQRADILAKPGFGRYFTDHMVRIDWTVDKSNTRAIRFYLDRGARVKAGTRLCRLGQEDLRALAASGP